MVSRGAVAVELPGHSLALSLARLSLQSNWPTLADRLVYTAQVKASSSGPVSQLEWKCFSVTPTHWFGKA